VKEFIRKISERLPFNPGAPKVQVIVAAVIILFLVAMCARAHAGDTSYAQFGMGATAIRGPTAVIDLSFVYPDAAPKDADLEVGATFIGASEFHDNGQPNNFALRAAIVEHLGATEVGIGAAYLQNTDTYNGSHANFNLILGLAPRSVPLKLRWQHFSNGGTQSPNKGRDMVLVYWVF
jgi:hypothetical protein